MILFIGIAAGKGVLLPKSKQEAIDAIKEVMLDKVLYCSNL